MSVSAAFKRQDAGFTRQQVEALGELLDGQAASKADLAKTDATLKADTGTLRSDLRDEVPAGDAPGMPVRASIPGAPLAPVRPAG